eukprot:Anaeramoba_ignava/a623857_4.p1 GENE.a623857_4~~a623857_4.p1  ORF type:complete len:224 (+),score=16.72 a623857_4:50-721(+)
MMICKKIFILLSFFYIFSVPQIFAQQFKTVDLERLISNHPLMQKFDQNTRKFKGTESENQNPKELKKQTEDLKQKLQALKKERKNVVLASFAPANNAKQSEKTWASLRQIDKQIKEIDDQIFDNEQLLTLNGVPPVTKIMPQVRQILKDSINKVASDKNAILLNKLPRFKSEPPKLSANPFQTFLENPVKQKLENYIAHRAHIGLLFSITDIPVITLEKESKK